MVNLQKQMEASHRVGMVKKGLAIKAKAGKLLSVAMPVLKLTRPLTISPGDMPRSYTCRLQPFINFSYPRNCTDPG